MLMPTTLEALAIIAILSVGTAITRFLPFIFFPNAEAMPRYIHYLGKMLPTAAISLLVVYCLRYVEIMVAPHGLPEAVSIAVVAGLHIWKNNTLLSIAVGTVVYMVIV